MIKNFSRFSGFSKETFKFLYELSKNNNKNFFDKNKERYQNFLVKPSKEFITTIAPFFEQLNPAIRREPKFNETIMRISKDMRFTKGEPYRNYFLIHFGRFKLDSEFFIYIDKSSIGYGLFINNTVSDKLFFKSNLDKFQKEISQTFKSYKLNNKFSLIDIEKTERLIADNFNFTKHFEKIKNLKWLLLQIQIKKTDNLCFSPELLNEAIKLFSRLYPIYCFTISANPLKLIQDFEDKMGVAK